MENNKERVMAYNLAKTIDKDALEDVSGGSSMSQRQTLGPSTGGGIKNLDTTLDIALDL